MTLASSRLISRIRIPARNRPTVPARRFISLILRKTVPLAKFNDQAEPQNQSGRGGGGGTTLASEVKNCLDLIIDRSLITCLFYEAIARGKCRRVPSPRIYDEFRARVPRIVKQRDFCTRKFWIVIARWWYVICNRFRIFTVSTVLFNSCN